MNELDYILARIAHFFENIETYINNHQSEIRANLISLDRWTARVSRRFVRLMVFGIILLFVAYFVPLEKDFPVLYEFAHGLVKLMEFMIRIVLGFIYNLFTGNLGTWWDKYTRDCNELFDQFGNWLSTL